MKNILVIAGCAREFDRILKDAVRAGKIARVDAKKYKYVSSASQLRGINRDETSVALWGEYYIHPVYNSDEYRYYRQTGGGRV